MKGIYLTEEGKKEIEAKIVELEKYNFEDEKLNGNLEGNVYCLKEILSSAIILPVYNNWEDVDFFPPDNESQTKKLLELKNGIIIQPKQ
jgi:hypothetical protein